MFTPTGDGPLPALRAVAHHGDSGQVGPGPRGAGHLQGVPRRPQDRGEDQGEGVEEDWRIPSRELLLQTCHSWLDLHNTNY